LSLRSSDRGLHRSAQLRCLRERRAAFVVVIFDLTVGLIKPPPAYDLTDYDNRYRMSIPLLARVDGTANSGKIGDVRFLPAVVQIG